MGSRNVERDKPICSEHMRLSFLAKEFPDWALNVMCRGCTHAGRGGPRGVTEGSPEMSLKEAFDDAVASIEWTSKHLREL